MSIDDRLRTGLPTALDGAPTDVEADLANLLSRVDRRKRRRRGAYAVGLAAAVATVLVVVKVAHDDPRSIDPVGPRDDRVRVLDSAVGSPDEPVLLEPGRYAIPFLGASRRAPLAVLSVPEGWSQDRLVPTTGPDLDPHLRRIELSSVRRVSPDPCDEPTVLIGRSFDALVEALTSQKSVRPGPPRPFGADGYAGKEIEFRVPEALGSRTCHPNQSSLVPFTTGEGAAVTEFKGWTYRVWALDVEGEPLVVVASLGPEVTPDEEADVVRMVERMELVAPGDIGGGGPD